MMNQDPILQQETEETKNNIKNEIQHNFEITKNAPIEYWRNFNIDNYVENLRGNEFRRFLEPFNMLPLPCLENIIV